MPAPQKKSRIDPARLAGDAHFRIDELTRRVDAIERLLTKLVSNIPSNQASNFPTKVGTIDLPGGPVTITLREMRS